MNDAVAEEEEEGEEGEGEREEEEEEEEDHGDISDVSEAQDDSWIPKDEEAPYVSESLPAHCVLEIWMPKESII